MDATTSNSLAELRLTAVKHALGLMHSSDFPSVADRALANGVYSLSLAELALVREPVMSDVAPLFERALGELGISLPSPSDAAWLLARHCIQRIASDSERPFEPLGLLKDVCECGILPDESYVGDSLDLGSLIGIYWNYTEPSENYFEPEKRRITDEDERQSLLDKLARREARAWLERHP